MGCSKCGGPTEGFKCDMCGEESTEHVESHACGGEHCMPKCQGCGESQVKCSCEAQAEPTGEASESSSDDSNDKN